MLARVLILLIILPIISFSQVQRRFSSYTTDNGLNQNTIYETIQDYRGYLWFSTANGISRFDGYEMHNYKYDPKDSTSIYGEFYFTFFEDSKKQLWVSHDKGLSYYDRIKDCFINVYKLKGSGLDSIQNILAEDRFNKLWITNDNKILYSFDIINKRIVDQIVLSKTPVLKRRTQKKAIFKNDILIFQNESHILHKFNTISKKLSKLYNSKNPRLEFEKYDENTYISVDPTNSLVLELKFNNQEIICKEKLIKLNKNWLSSSIAYSNGKYYVGTLEGLVILDKKNLNKNEQIKNFGQYTQSFVFMESIYVDKAENIILGTNGMGVRILSPHTNKFMHIGSNEEKLNMTKSILTTKSGKIIVGLHAIGFVIIDKNNNYKYQHVNFPPQKERDKANSHVYGMIEINDDEILMVYGDRLIIYNHKKNKIIKSQKKYLEVIQPLVHFEKYKNAFYLNISDSTKYHINKINYDLSFNKIFEIKDTPITTYNFYNDSLMFIGTTKGLIIRNFKNNKRIRNISNIYVKSILINSNREIYIGTIKGLYKINTKGEILEYYDENSGINNDNIYGVLEDSNYNLWMSHNKGLSLFLTKEKRFINYTNIDGLQSNEFNTGSYYKDINGLLYFGGVNGINIIEPKNIQSNRFPPNVALNKIYLFDELFQSDTFYNELNVLNLNYTQNTLSFDFSSLDYSNPSSNKFKYILEGYDHKMVESGTRHFARYANIPPGNYTLKIYGSNNDGVWSTEPKIIHINITPPYWQKTWFYWLIGTSIILFVMGIIYLIINQQKIKLKRKLEIQRQLELERLRISRDLHDHVGAQLSYLISNLDWLVSHPDALDKEEELNRLSNLSETGRQAILTLRQTIWALNNTELSIEDFADKYKSFAKKMLEFNPNIHIVFHESISVNHKLSPGVALNLFRICQEALGNALKHSKATEIIVEFKSDMENVFEFKLTDNGIGFDIKNSAKEDHYGILNMKARAIEANAQLEIISEIGNGTTIKIHHLHYVSTQE